MSLKDQLLWAIRATAGVHPDAQTLGAIVAFNEQDWAKAFYEPMAWAGGIQPQDSEPFYGQAYAWIDFNQPLLSASSLRFPSPTLDFNRWLTGGSDVKAAYATTDADFTYDMFYMIDDGWATMMDSRREDYSFDSGVCGASGWVAYPNPDVAVGTTALSLVAVSNVLQIDVAHTGGGGDTLPSETGADITRAPASWHKDITHVRDCHGDEWTGAGHIDISLSETYTLDIAAAALQALSPLVINLYSWPEQGAQWVLGFTCGDSEPIVYASRVDYLLAVNIPLAAAVDPDASFLLVYDIVQRSNFPRAWKKPINSYPDYNGEPLMVAYQTSVTLFEPIERCLEDYHGQYSPGEYQWDSIPWLSAFADPFGNPGHIVRKHAAIRLKFLCLKPAIEVRLTFNLVWGSRVQSHDITLDPLSGVIAIDDQSDPIGHPLYLEALRVYQRDSRGSWVLQMPDEILDFGAYDGWEDDLDFFQLFDYRKSIDTVTLFQRRNGRLWGYPALDEDDDSENRYRVREKEHLVRYATTASSDPDYAGGAIDISGSWKERRTAGNTHLRRPESVEMLANAFGPDNNSFPYEPVAATASISLTATEQIWRDGESREIPFVGACYDTQQNPKGSFIASTQKMLPLLYDAASRTLRLDSAESTVLDAANRTYAIENVRVVVS